MDIVTMQPLSRGFCEHGKNVFHGVFVSKRASPPAYIKRISQDYWAGSPHINRLSGVTEGKRGKNYLSLIFQHSKRNFVPPRGHVISSISFTYLAYILIHIKSRITKSTSPSITKLESFNDPVIC